ncbi:hypothetical protein X947_5794 [Burkholderia pseudomallei MSHR7334]|nr:hypothetical protein X948_5546 [Burkholderia pseudomallei MSHR5608]KGS73431.1 hypothetical protein X947_5794 [Burkholderia pseudomallei MSHR7334]
MNGAGRHVTGSSEPTMMTDRWLILDLYRQPHPQLTAYPVRVGTVSDGGRVKR